MYIKTRKSILLKSLIIILGRKIVVLVLYLVKISRFSTKIQIKLLIIYEVKIWTEAKVLIIKILIIIK